MTPDEKERQALEAELREHFPDVEWVLDTDDSEEAAARRYGGLENVRWTGSLCGFDLGARYFRGEWAVWIYHERGEYAGARVLSLAEAREVMIVELEQKASRIAAAVRALEGER